MAKLKQIKTTIANPIRVGVFGIGHNNSNWVNVPAGSTVNIDINIDDGSYVVGVWDNLSQGQHGVVVTKGLDLAGDTGLSVTPNNISGFTPV